MSITSVMVETSSQFAATRQRLGLSVNQCAYLVNVDENTLRRWERGVRDPAPSACRVLELAAAGHIPSAVLTRLISGRGL